MRLKNSVAIVTGGGGGIGTGISKCLAREGADVVVADLDIEAAQRVVEQVEKAGRRGYAVRSDVTKEGDCQDLVDQALQACDHLDILVNNAGYFGSRVGGPVLDHDESEWDNQYSISVKAPLHLCRAVSAHMIERKRGKIISISSIAARRDPLFLPAYAMGKNALLSVTRLLAKELAPHGINVNAVCPGLLWTAFWQDLAPMMAENDPSYAGLTPREVFEKFVQGATPMGREQTPEDIGNLVAFLASEESRNITGQIIHVDGGVAMLP